MPTPIECQICKQSVAPLLRFVRDLIESTYEVGEDVTCQELYRVYVARARVAITEYQKGLDEGVSHLFGE